MWKRILIFSVATFVLLRQIIPISQLIRDLPLNDFSVYLDGTRSTVRGENPYTQKFFDRYNYPPAATVFFLPLTTLPVDIAEIVFTVLSVVALWYVVILMMKLCSLKLSPLIALVLFALALKTFPVKLTLVLGQINIFILLFVVASFYLTPKRPWLSGFFLGLATILKLTPAPLVLFYLVKRQGKIVASWTGTVLMLTVVGILKFGWPLTKYYVATVLPMLLSETSRETLKTFYMNQSLAAMLGRMGVFSITNTITRLTVSLTLLVCIVFVSHQKRKSEIQQFATWVIVVFLVLPSFVWQHHFVFLLVPWLLLAAKSIKRPYSWTTAATIVGYVLLNIHIIDPYLPQRLPPLLATHFLLTAGFVGLSSFLTGLNSKKPQLTTRLNGR